MKKILLVALVALSSVSFGFGNAQDCINECQIRNPHNEHCAATCYEAAAVEALSSVKGTAPDEVESPSAVIDEPLEK